MHSNRCDLFHVTRPDSCGVGEGLPDADLFPVPPAGYFLLILALAFLPRYAHADESTYPAWEPAHAMYASIEGPPRAVGIVASVTLDEIEIEGVELHLTGGEYIQILTGPAAGTTARILDGQGSRIRISKSVAHLLAQGDTFAIRSYPEIEHLYG